MKDNTIFIGLGKNIRLGCKGNRYKLMIDNIELSKEVKEQIEASIVNHKLKGTPILSLKNFIRNQKIRVSQE